MYWGDIQHFSLVRHDEASSYSLCAKQCKACVQKRHVQHALKEKLEQEYARLQKEGIYIVPV